MSPELCNEIASTLEEAGRADLAARLRSEVSQDQVLTSVQAAEVLGVSSPNTVKNWMENGMFPGAYKTRGGHWRFPRSEVERVREQMTKLQEKNAKGDLSPPDIEDPQEPPLL